MVVVLGKDYTLLYKDVKDSLFLEIAADVPFLSDNEVINAWVSLYKI